MNMMSVIAPEAAEDAALARCRMGEMLLSAIQRGGLLDAATWCGWIAGVSKAITICGTLVSVEISLGRRWFADPTTAILILRWHRDSLALPPEIDAEQLLADCVSEHGGVEQVIAAARAALEFKIPGLMIAFASGALPSLSVPRSTWERVVYGRWVPDEPPEEGALEQVRQEPCGLREMLQGELRALGSGARVPRYTAGRKAKVSAKASAREALMALPAADDPVRTTLRAWCHFALRKGRGRASPGYSPTTVRDYLAALAVVLDGLSICPLDLPIDAINDRVNAARRRMDGREIAKAANALRSFQKFAGEELGRPIILDLEKFEIEQVGAAELVLPEAYHKARQALRRAGDEDQALALTLMFRAGIRVDEVRALRVGDVSVLDERIELVVEANNVRMLKTPTSRRILPLDVLLDREEQVEVSRRVHARLKSCGGIGGSEAWLFGPAFAVEPPTAAGLSKRIDVSLRVASGSDRVNQNHLRHSFASYLLATLLLPQDDPTPAVPPALAEVVSHARFHRVADRLLGAGRLGAGAVHAVSQMMGHTGPDTTLRYYCHLLDLSLGLHCSRPSVLARLERKWLIESLGVSSEALRKAGARVRGRGTGGEDSAIVARPDTAAIARHTPDFDRKLADARLIAAAVKRLAREPARSLGAWMEEVEAPSRRAGRTSLHTVRGVVLPAVPRSTSFHLQWRDALGGHNADDLAGAPVVPELIRFVDRRLQLERRLRSDERVALAEVMRRYDRGRTDIRLKRLRDAEAFVRLLRVMGFRETEINLSVTGKAGGGMPSAQVHRFLQDRSTTPHLAGRSGWRGSLVVRLSPKGLRHPILSARACRFALATLARYQATIGK